LIFSVQNTEQHGHRTHNEPILYIIKFNASDLHNEYEVDMIEIKYTSLSVVRNMVMYMYTLNIYILPIQDNVKLLGYVMYFQIFITGSRRLNI